MGKFQALMSLLLLVPATRAQTPLFERPHDMLPPEADRSACAAFGDVDSDGDLDLFAGAEVGSALSQGRLLLNDGRGCLRRSPLGLAGLATTAEDAAFVDVDGDGDLDLVIANVSTANRLYLNDGSGTFGDYSGWLPSGNAVALALGDVNGDGAVDIYFGRGGSTMADQLLLNNGGGFFMDLSRNLPPGSAHATGPVLVDVDGDGDLDLLLAARGPERLFLNDGAGVFGDASGQLPATLSPQSSALAVGDVDGDGDSDALFGFLGTRNQLLLNDGAGTFADATARLPATPDMSVAVALVDVDGDGDLDALVQNFEQPDSLYLNDGTGTFRDASASLPRESRPDQGFAVGDVDGDRDPDLYMAGRWQDRLYLNDGSGGFGDVTGPFLPAHPGEITSAAVGDVDGDGNPDVLLGNYDEHRSTFLQNLLLLNDGYGGFVDATGQLPATPDDTGGVALGDLDGDGDLDALVIADRYPLSRLDLNNGRGMFHTAPNALPYFSVVKTGSILLGDVDGDGDLDVHIADNHFCGILLLNDGGGTFRDASLNLSSCSSVRRAHFADIDQDGDLDLLAGMSSLAPLLNDGRGVFRAAYGNLPPLTQGLGPFDSGDLDGDGDPDLLVALWSTSGWRVRVLLNDGSGLFRASPQSPILLHEEPLRLVLADLDGDGDLDAYLGMDGRDALLLNDGSGVFADATARMPAEGGATGVLVLADLDGDGDVDALRGGSWVGRQAFQPYSYVGIYSNLSRQLAWRALPRFGKSMPVLLAGPAAEPWLLFLSPLAAAAPLPPYGTLGLDPSALWLIGAGALDASGRAELDFHLPSRQIFPQGLTFYGQALVGRAARLSNVERFQVFDL